jgi:hypothetical protein
MINLAITAGSSHTYFLRYSYEYFYISKMYFCILTMLENSKSTSER